MSATSRLGLLAIVLIGGIACGQSSGVPGDGGPLDGNRVSDLSTEGLKDSTSDSCPPIKCVLSPATDQHTPYDTDIICTGVAECGSFKHEHLCLCFKEDYSNPNSPGMCWCFMKPGGMAFAPWGVCGIPREKRTVALAEEARSITRTLTDAGCGE